MSESRNNGESRGCGYGSSYVTSSSESRDMGESRYNPINDTTYNESINNNGVNNGKNSKYNNLTDIDALIERMEKETPQNPINSVRVNQALKERQSKINELKALREQIKKEAEEEKILKLLDESNNELDEAIASVKKLVKTPAKQIQTSDDFYDSSESHWGGESHY